MSAGGRNDRRRLRPDGIDWHAPGDAARAEALRVDLERETRTLSGFRRRVRTEREYSILGAIIAVPVLVFTVADPLLSLVSIPPIDVLERFVESGGLWLAVSIVLIGSSVIASAVRIRREFALFQQNGWIAFAASTGLVRFTGDGASSIEYDHRMVGGKVLLQARNFGDPLMLVSGARMPVAAFTAAVDAMRVSAKARTRGDESLKRLTRETSVLRAVPADAWFRDTGGCLLGVTRDGDFVAAIPRPTRDGRSKSRLGRICLTSAEKVRR